MLLVTKDVYYITLIILQYIYFYITYLYLILNRSSADERPPASFFLRQANARSEALKRGDCLSEASSSPFSGTKEVSRRKNAALILSFGIFSFASRRKKSTPPHHSIIFSIGNTNIPSAPNAFSFPIISQKRFSSSTVCTEHQPS